MNRGGPGVTAKSPGGFDSRHRDDHARPGHCNHDITALYATSFEREMRRVFPGPHILDKIPDNHAIFRSLFPFPDGLPADRPRIERWGDDLVQDYLRAVERRGRIGVRYPNIDYGCEWDYDRRNKRFQRDDNTSSRSISSLMR